MSPSIDLPPVRDVDYMAFFNERAAMGERSPVPGGSTLYHGFQGNRPHLDNTRALWVASRSEVAHAYRDFGRRTSTGGVIVLALRREMTAVAMYPDGLALLEAIGRGGHTLFAACLHDWASRRGVELIDEGNGSFIVMRPATDLQLIGYDALLPGT